MEKTRTLKAIAIAACVLFANTIAAKADDIESRVARQQGKIGNKRAGKKISAEQASRADDMSYKISSEEQEMKTKHKGKLTRKDKAKLNRQLNRNDRVLNNSEKNHKH